MDLITNRTGEETYEYSDLNRVETAVKAIISRFQELGIGVQLETKTDWELPENFTAHSWPVKSQMDRYLRNVAEIKKVFPNDIRLPESMDNLTAEGANNIEKVLIVANQRIDGIFNAFRYSGDLVAGEEI